MRQRTPKTNGNNSLIDWRKMRQKEDSLFTTILDSTKERGEDESKDSGFKQGYRDNGVQCDLLLEKIGEKNEYEELLTQKDKEIASLRAELDKMKVD